MTTERLLKDLEALRRYTAQTLDESSRPVTAKDFARVARKTQDLLATAPALNNALQKLFFDSMSAEEKVTVEALRFVTDRLEQILVQPEVQRSPDVAKVVKAVHESVARLTVFDVSEETILKAFAAPALSIKNTRIARNLRSDKVDVDEAHNLFLQWASNPDLYPTKAAFARDCLRKELCDTDDTVFKWLSRFSKDMRTDHPLREKLGKLKD